MYSFTFKYRWLNRTVECPIRYTVEEMPGEKFLMDLRNCHTMRCILWTNDHEVKWSEVKVTQLCLTLCDPMDYTVHAIPQARILEWVAFPFSGIEPRSPTLQMDSLPVKPQGKPKNIVMGNLSLLQRIFPNQESNQGLLHCRQILYKLRYQGNTPRTICNVISSIARTLESRNQGI